MKKIAYGFLSVKARLLLKVLVKKALNAKRSARFLPKKC